MIIKARRSANTFGQIERSFFLTNHQPPVPRTSFPITHKIASYLCLKKNLQCHLPLSPISPFTCGEIFVLLYLLVQKMKDYIILLL